MRTRATSYNLTARRVCATTGKFNSEVIKCRPFLPHLRAHLVLRHGDLNRDMIMFRQENDGKLYLSMDVANINELIDPGLLRCVRNTLHKQDLLGTYHINHTNFLTRALLEIPQHDVATVTLGYFLRELYTLGLVTNVPLESLRESMVLADSVDERIHSVFFVDDLLIKTKLLVAPTANLPSLVLQNDMPVKSQGELLRLTAGGATEHFSLIDFLYDVSIRKFNNRSLTNKLLSVFVGAGSAPTLLTSTQLRRTGERTSDINVPARGRVSQEEALKNIMNPASTALQYRIVTTAAKSTFLEPILTDVK
jgi:hypothetical protein